MKGKPLTPNRAALVSIVFAAIFLRVLFLYFTRDTRLLFDEGSYLRMAREVVADGGFDPLWRWPPGQPYFMAGLFCIFGENLLVVKAVQVVLSTVSVYLIHLIARRVFEHEVTALIAAGMAAVYPAFIAFSHYLWSENLFILLSLCFIYWLLRFVKSLRTRYLVVAGCFFAMGSLTRSLLIVATPLVLAYLAIRLRLNRPALLQSILVFVVTVVVVMSPWMIRNLRVHEGWVLIAPNTGMNLWRGNSRIFGITDEGEDFSRELYEAHGSTAVEREKYAFEKAIGRIRAHQPFWIAKKATVYLRTWDLNRSFVLSHYRQRHAGKISDRTEAWLFASIRGLYLVVMLGAILGLTWTNYNWEKRFFVGLLLLFSVVYIVTISNNPRMRVTVMPLLVMFSAEGYQLLGRWLSSCVPARGVGLRDWRSNVTRPTVSKRLVIRVVLYCLATGLFLYNSTVDMVPIVERVLR